jgi:hypothetical protein
VQVRRLVLDHEGEQFGEIHYNPPSEKMCRCFRGLWLQLPTTCKL